MTETTADTMPPNIDKYALLRVESVRPSALNPRLDFDEDAITELANSIRLHGLKSPVLVRPLAEPVGEVRFEIVAGERRYRAMRLLGEQAIAAIIGEATDAEALEIALEENLKRRGLNPIEEARAFSRLADMGYTQERIAERINWQQPNVAKRLGLLKLPETVQMLIAGGKLTAGHGVILQGINAEHPEKTEEVARRVVADSLTTAATQAVVNALVAERQAASLQPGLPLDAPTVDAVATPVEARNPRPEPGRTTATPAVPAASPSPKPEPTPEPTPVATPSVPETKPETKPVFVDNEPIALPSPGARIGASILKDDDDWMFEVGIETIDEAFAMLRAQHPYLLDSLGRKILKSLTGVYNDANPNAPIAPSDRLAALLTSKAKEAGFDVETLKGLPE